MANISSNRYSDDELAEFRALINEKIQKANDELNYTRHQITELSENGFNQQGGDWYDDTSTHAELEMLNRIVVRQMKYIQDLRNALYRIDNKTYGICTVTGQLIDKQRLRAVPHATKSVDGKNIANKNQVVGDIHRMTDTLGSLYETSNNTIKTTVGNLRLPIKKSISSDSDDWEPNNENMEDAGYQNIE